ncbi:hypothetical protein A5682_16215 [Mycobacterium mantenii]|uniref:Uncharacterized protein n=2 Tax=Mycobacterium mantenii TaxID=560555 RepID=A0A1A2TUS4_MYCNT|nr:hypothetical protein A5688_26365 [Mycobacterium mantenii]OBH67711.1 hypothetical protein A5683_08960 [Mycobacterium mantenii]OBH80134.1 hypothetical protein A5682_16215 [Mycobacterium mantenii]
MCFSMTADLVVGTALVPVAVATLREVKHWREVPFALLPAVFAVHQFIEVAVWPNGVVSPGMAQLAVRAYVFIALPLLPALVPWAILLLEPRGARLRVAPFAVLGTVVSAYLAVVVLTEPVTATTGPHALQYRTGVHDGYVWAVLYIIAVIGPAVMSGYRSIVVFGVANLVGLIVVAVLYLQAFASLWCIYAATLSVLALVHMVRRRRLPDPHRYHGVAADRAPSNA